MGGFDGKMGFEGGLWLKIEVYGKNGGFFGKWGFHGILVKKLGKSREEPGI